MTISTMERSSEKQQLVEQDVEEEESKVAQLPLSPVISSKMSSSGNASQASRSHGRNFSGTGNSSTDAPKIAFVNERKNAKDNPNRAAANNRSKNMFKETPDVKHMETALLELLDDFHTGKLRAFGKGCSMEQMMDIREQQERLAKLHFHLGTGPELSNRDEFLNQSCHSKRASDNMTQLVQSLEQLSVSIEQLHSDSSILKPSEKNKNQNVS